MSLIPQYFRARASQTVTELSARLRAFLESKGLPDTNIEDAVKLVVDLGGLKDSFYSDNPIRFVGFSSQGAVGAQLSAGFIQGLAKRTVIDRVIICSDLADLISLFGTRIGISGNRPVQIRNRGRVSVPSSGKATCGQTTNAAAPNPSFNIAQVRTSSTQSIDVDLDWRMGPPDLANSIAESLEVWTATVNTALRVTFIGRESDTLA